MSTTVELDPEGYSLAEAYAGEKGLSLSAAIKDALRRAEQASKFATPSSRLKMGPHGFLVIASNGHVLTPEMVRELSEDPIE